MEQIKSAIEKYCRYQERCHKEVKNKLFSLGCRGTDADEIIADLITQNLLNEERYAVAIARGKFRMKGWGRQKIMQTLKRNNISDWCIHKAMAEIEEEIYYDTLAGLIKKKAVLLAAEKNRFVLRGKLYRYMVQKGYEPDEVNKAIKQYLDGQKQ